MNAFNFLCYNESMKDLSILRLREVLNYDPVTGIFTWKTRIADRIKIGDVAGTVYGLGYRLIRIDGQQYHAHRLAWLYMTGAWPVHGIDHINGERDQNQFINLRDVPPQYNAQNKRRPAKNNVSGYLGVSWYSRGKCWRAGIRVNGKGYHLGYFNDPAKAHQVYLAAKREQHQACTI